MRSFSYLDHASTITVKKSKTLPFEVYIYFFFQTRGYLIRIE